MPECDRRILQWEAPRRVSEPPVISEPYGCEGGDRAVATALLAYPRRAKQDDVLTAVEEPQLVQALDLLPVEPQGLDQLVNLPRRHPVDVRLLHDGAQRRVVAARAHLRHRQFDRPDPRIPAPGPTPVAISRPLVSTLMPFGADQSFMSRRRRSNRSDRA